MVMNIGYIMIEITNGNWAIMILWSKIPTDVAESSAA